MGLGDWIGAADVISASAKLVTAVNGAVERSAASAERAATKLNEVASADTHASASAQLSKFATRIGASGARAVSAKCIGCHAPLSGVAGESCRCPYCDTVQTLG